VSWYCLEASLEKTGGDQRNSKLNVERRKALRENREQYKTEEKTAFQLKNSERLEEE